MADRHLTRRPNCERAHAFSAGFCADPGCGLHLTALRADDSPICEIIVGRHAVRELIDLIHDQGLDL